MHEDLINQIQNLKQRIEDERELSFSHMDMVHNVLPILKNMELVLAQRPEPIAWMARRADWPEDKFEPFKFKPEWSSQAYPLYSSLQASIATPQPQSVPESVLNAIRTILGMKTQTGEERKYARRGAREELRRWHDSITNSPLIEPLSADEHKASDDGDSPEWQDISTADLTDDLIWLFDGVDSIEGPRCLETDDYDRYAYWAECTWPSTLPIRNSHE